MHEIFPIASGVVLALMIWRFAAPRLRLLALVVLSFVFGFLASLISGELALSWAFPWIDTALVLLAAGATVAVMAARRRIGTVPRSK